MKFIFNNKEYPSIDGVKKAYYNGQGPVPPDPDTIPFYCENTTGNSITVYIEKQDTSYSPTITAEKSSNNKDWVSVDLYAGVIINPGEKVYLRATSSKDGTWCGTEGWGTNFFRGVDKIGGNILSLLYGSNFTGRETIIPNSRTYCFHRVFYNTTSLINAEELLLPVIALTESCYNRMFEGCTSLVKGPVELPSTDTAVNGCYNGMFSGCTSLTESPMIRARSLVNYSCTNMFNNCSSLNTVKCLATWRGSSSTGGWLSGVAASGTFYKNASMKSWPSGTNGIPNGWTVVDV